MWFLLYSVLWAGTVDKVISDVHQEMGVYDQIESTKTNNPFRDVEAFVSNDTWKERATVEMGLKLKLKPYQEWQLSRQDATNAELIKKINRGATFKNRFETLLGYKQTVERAKIYRDIIKRFDQLIKVLEIDIVGGRDEPRTLLNTRSERERYIADLKLSELNRENYFHLLSLWTGDAEPQEDYSFIPLARINSVLLAIPQKQATLTDQLKQEELSQIEKEMKILRARDRQWFNEIEVKRNDIQREEEFEVGVKFRIPLLSSDSWARQKINELLIKRTLKQRELREQIISIEDLSRKLLGDIERYNRLSDSKMRTLNRSARGILDSEIKKLKDKIEIVDLLESIYIQYIYILFESDKLETQYLIGSK